MTILAVLSLAAYHASFSTPFVFDDVPGIVENPTIRHLWPIGEVLAPQLAGGVTVSGRPVVNLSFALNYALGGDHVQGYHAVNFAIHLAAGLLLFGIVRHTLRFVRLGSSTNSSTSVESESLLVAFFIAALWILHPLQTESVTYIVQRAESLAGFFYLLTLYCFIRAVGGKENVADARPVPAVVIPSLRQNRLWSVAGVTACALGMASKEIVASAPLIVLLYDRTFVAHSFRAAWRVRWRTHSALFATWLLLAWLLIGTGGRGGTAGFSTGISSWHYALTQCAAIPHYLRLTFWPRPLVFDYGLATETNPLAVLPQALVLLGLLAATVFALWRKPALGFLGAWFFALLAPSSSVVPVITQTMAEHRMYLPLAGVIALAVSAAFTWLGRRAASGCAVAGLALALATNARNHDYRSDAAIWADTAAKLPTNARAHNNLGQALFREGKIAEAKASYERALALQPKYPETHYNLGVAFAHEGNLPLAIEQYETALRYEPRYPEAHTNLGNALVQLDHVPEAIRHYEEALRIKPDFAEAYSNLGNAQLLLGDANHALASFQSALRLKPAYAEALYNLGNAFAGLGRIPEALDAYQRAIAANPVYAEAHVNAGNVLLQLGRPTDALAYYEKAVSLDPRLAEAQYNLGSALLELERWNDAATRFQELLKLTPDSTNAHRALGLALAKSGRTTEAIPQYEFYLRKTPDDTTAQAELAQLRLDLARKP